MIGDILATVLRGMLVGLTALLLDHACATAAENTGLQVVFFPSVAAVGDNSQGTMTVQGRVFTPATGAHAALVGLMAHWLATKRNVGVKRTDVASDQPADTVVSQSPSSAAPGATITLSVSKGPKQSTVPDVTGEDETSAKDELKAAGFKVQVQHQDVTDPSQNGIVISQTPGGGTQADHGSTVTIVVGQFTPQAP